MHFASLKEQDRRVGGWNWPQITRMKQIFADTAQISADVRHAERPEGAKACPEEPKFS